MKNYIEEVAKNYNINNGEKFTFDNFEHICFINEFYELECETLSPHQRDALLLGVMLGKRIPVKIKPKTLTEKLKEQGYGYAINIHADNGAEYVNVNNSIFNALLKMGAMYLTESDCKREMYRRELEFEMQEWARENDCLGDAGHMSIQPYNGFNVCVKDFGFNERLKGVFNEKVDKYYNFT